MAVALHERTGWPIQTLAITRSVRGNLKSTIHHAFVVAPGGEYYDGLGEYDPAWDLERIKNSKEHAGKIVEYKTFTTVEAFRAALKADGRDWLYENGEPCHVLQCAELLLKAQADIPASLTKRLNYHSVRPLSEIHQDWLPPCPAPKTEITPKPSALPAPGFKL